MTLHSIRLRTRRIHQVANRFPYTWPIKKHTLIEQSIPSPPGPGSHTRFCIICQCQLLHRTTLLCCAALLAFINGKCILVSQQGVTERCGVQIWCHLVSNSGVTCHSLVLLSGVRTWCCYQVSQFGDTIWCHNLVLVLVVQVVVVLVVLIVLCSTGCTCS